MVLDKRIALLRRVEDPDHERLEADLNRTFESIAMLDHLLRQLHRMHGSYVLHVNYNEPPFTAPYNPRLNRVQG